jgi:hypothetical protein
MYIYKCSHKRTAVFPQPMKNYYWLVMLLPSVGADAASQRRKRGWNGI